MPLPRPEWHFHRAFVFHFLDFKFPSYVCHSEQHTWISFFFSNVGRKIKNTWKQSESSLFSGLFLIDLSHFFTGKDRRTDSWTKQRKKKRKNKERKKHSVRKRIVRTPAGLRCVLFCLIQLSLLLSSSVKKRFSTISYISHRRRMKIDLHVRRQNYLFFWGGGGGWSALAIFPSSSRQGATRKHPTVTWSFCLLLGGVRLRVTQYLWYCGMFQKSKPKWLPFMFRCYYTRSMHVLRTAQEKCVK